MSNSAKRFLNIIKNTSESTNKQTSKVVSLKIKSLSPLVFTYNDKLTIDNQFYVLDKNFTTTNLRRGDIYYDLQVGDSVQAMMMNNGQTYYVLGNKTISSGGGGTSNYNNLENKPQINGNTLSGNMSTSDLGISVPTKTSDLTNDSGFYSKPDSGIPDTDLSSAVQTSLGKADTALQGMTILSYGSSTWNDFITAYNKKSVVYCRASSNANPATGSQTRLAFMAYVNNAENPTQVEFQYYRSVTSHTDSQQGDQVFVYLLKNTGVWSVTTRNAFSKVVAGTNMTSSYSSGVITLNATDTTYSAGTGIDITNNIISTTGGGGTSDYTDLTNKPQINGVTLSGNKSLSDLGITYSDTDLIAGTSPLASGTFYFYYE